MRRILGTTLAGLLLAAPAAFAHTVPYPHSHETHSMLPFAAVSILATLIVSLLVRAARHQPEA